MRDLLERRIEGAVNLCRRDDAPGCVPLGLGAGFVVTDQHQCVARQEADGVDHLGDPNDAPFPDRLAVAQARHRGFILNIGGPLALGDQ